MSMDCSQMAQEATRQIAEASTKESLEALRIRYLGRKGVLQGLFAKIPTLPQEERKTFGAQVNALRERLGALVREKEAQLRDQASSGAGGLDVTLPGKRVFLGKRHPLMQVERQICDIFRRLGFDVYRGPETETEFNNFEALNIPLEHPSRDAFDTFYISPQSTVHSPRKKTKDQRLLLRSHTSPSQIRVMKENTPPLAVLMPGRVYRPDAVDASHSFMFHQVEGIAVDKKIRFSDLKGVLTAFAREMFSANTKMRFRPSFFPFTEPSAEVDISCIICNGRGCSVCKKSGWLEILGCGMIHPHVFQSCGYPSRRWRGLAFGMGVERIAMLKYGIHDIRLFFENDLRFLEQF